MSVSTAVYLFEVDVWNGTSVETWYLSTKTKSTGPSDTPPNAAYRGLIMDAGQIDRQINFSAGAVSPGFSPASFRVDNLRNNMNLLLDPDNNYSVDGREFRLKQLSSISLPVSSATMLARGTMRGVDASDALRSVQFLGSDQLALLDKPLLTQKYAGTTLAAGPTAEGDESLTGQFKPLLLGGPCLNVTPKIVNRFDLIYQLSYAPLNTIVAYDGGLPLVNVGDRPSLAALNAVTMVPGQFATCLTLGCFRLGGSPERAVTADGAQVFASASQTVQTMMSIFGVSPSVIDAASFAAFHTAYPGQVAIWIDSDASLLSLIGTVAGSSLGTVIPTDLGIYQALYMTDPSLRTPSDTYSLRDIGVDGSSFAYLLGSNDDGTGIPAWRVTVNYSKNWTVMSGGDLLGLVDAATRSRLTNPLGVLQAAPSTAQNAAILTAHPLANDIKIETVLVNQNDAEEQAKIRFGLVGRKRAKLVTPINFDRAAPAIGSVVRLKDTTHPLLSVGRNYLVLGRKDDMTKRTRYLKLWG
jgi:hypothetical protein